MQYSSSVAGTKERENFIQFQFNPVVHKTKTLRKRKTLKNVKNVTQIKKT